MEKAALFIFGTKLNWTSVYGIRLNVHMNALLQILGFCSYCLDVYVSLLKAQLACNFVLRKMTCSSVTAV